MYELRKQNTEETRGTAGEEGDTCGRTWKRRIGGNVGGTEVITKAAAGHVGAFLSQSMLSRHDL